MTDVIVLAGADERDLTQLDEYRAVVAMRSSSGRAEWRLPPSSTS